MTLYKFIYVPYDSCKTIFVRSIKLGSIYIIVTQSLNSKQMRKLYVSEAALDSMDLCRKLEFKRISKFSKTNKAYLIQIIINWPVICCSGIEP